MKMRCEEAQELITGLVDNELSHQDRNSIESHLKDCLRCQFIYREGQALKREVRMAGSSVIAPSDLRERILSDRRIFPETANLQKGWKGFFGPAKELFRPAFVFALLVLLVLPTLYLMRSTEKSISQSALQTHEKIVGGALSFTKAGSKEGIREQLFRSVGGRFAPMGYDLSMMGLQPAGGMVQEVGGRKIIVTIYEGKGTPLSCYTFLGTEEDAPAEAGLYFDAEKKINFYTFSRGGVNAVFHREGKVICILVSEMPVADLLALARSQAQPS